MAGVDVEGNISSAIRNREIAAVQTEQNIQNFADGALIASYFIPGVALARLGVTAVKFGANQLMQQTVKSTIVGATATVAGVETIKGGLGIIANTTNGLLTGIDPYEGTYDAIAETTGTFNKIVNAGGDGRIGASFELRFGSAKIGELKALTGTDFDFAISGKLSALEQKLPNGQAFNQSVRFDFNDSFVPTFNLIHEHDFNNLGIKTPIFETKSVLRQNLSDGVSLPRVGVNTKLQFTPVNILGFSFTPAIVAEGRY
uniref:Uncharacterized protein n=1 Tax=Rheinheimera sp. BAL341 TaxID=1708203 RepID=A0A486XUM4_9GAMM